MCWLKSADDDVDADADANIYRIHIADTLRGIVQPSLSSADDVDADADADANICRIQIAYASILTCA